MNRISASSWGSPKPLPSKEEAERRDELRGHIIDVIAMRIRESAKREQQLHDFEKSYMLYDITADSPKKVDGECEFPFFRCDECC